MNGTKAVSGQETPPKAMPNGVTSKAKAVPEEETPQKEIGRFRSRESTEIYDPSGTSWKAKALSGRDLSDQENPR